MLFSARKVEGSVATQSLPASRLQRAMQMDVGEVGAFLQELASPAVCEGCAQVLSGQCQPCATKAERARRWRNMRLVTLLTILCGVCGLARQEWQRRQLGWDRPQRLAVILVGVDGARLSSGLINQFARQSAEVEQRLLAERRRYDAEASLPVEVSVFGPAAEHAPPPSLQGASLWDLLVFNFELASYARAQDQHLELRKEDFDVRIYVRLSESDGANETVEGVGQERGSIGVVSTHISKESTEFAWFVVVHEYFHTRGASDKYDSSGRATYPFGHAEPHQHPLYPQASIELMARGRPLSGVIEAVPGAPETWKIGPWTAEEIGWIPGSSSRTFSGKRHSAPAVAVLER
jgi:hypothetical protein